MPNQQIAHRQIICLRRFSSENGKASSEKAKKKDISSCKSKKNITCRFIKTHFLRYENEHSTCGVTRLDIKEIRKNMMARKKEMNHETSCHQEDFSASLHVGMPKTGLIA